MIYPNNLFPPNNIRLPFMQVKMRMNELIAELMQSRIIQKTLVYLIGLSPSIVQIENKLKSFEYFGQYGKIIKLVVNKNKLYNSNGPNGPSYTCFITYSSEAESSLAILSLDKSIIDNHEIKANYGTTKYCLNFLKNYECKNKDCIYLHQLADKKNIVSREQMNTDKDLFPQQRLMAIELSEILTNQKYKELYRLKDIKTVFPNCFSVYNKDLVIQYIKEKNLGIALNLNVSELTIVKKNNNKNKKNNNEADKKNEEEKLDNAQMSSKIKMLFDEMIDFEKFYLFKNPPKSRFNFARTEEIIVPKIPSYINEFLTQQCKNLSKYSQEEQNDLSNEYFSYRYLDADNSWKALVSSFNKWNSKKEEEKKFETY